jgi:hypothetical protein
VPHRTQAPTPDRPTVARPAAYPTGVIVGVGFATVVAGCLLAALVVPPQAAHGAREVIPGDGDIVDGIANVERVGDHR